MISRWRAGRPALLLAFSPITYRLPSADAGAVPLMVTVPPAPCLKVSPGGSAPRSVTTGSGEPEVLTVNVRRTPRPYARESARSTAQVARPTAGQRPGGGTCHRGKVIGQALAARLPGARLALGGGGLLHWIIRLIIWRELFRLFRYLWRIPTFGPYLCVLLGLVIIGLLVWQQRWRASRQRGRPGDGGTDGHQPGSGPRDW